MFKKTKGLTPQRKIFSAGFTLLEILLVVALIAILAAAIFVALNPSRRLAETNNAQRWTDVTAVLNAVLAYTIDNNGTLPSGIDSTYSNAQMLGTCTTDDSCTATTTVNCVDLTSDLVANGYISEIPSDPVHSVSTSTDYYVDKDAAGIIVVGACTPDDEGGTTPTIRVKR